MKHLFLLSLFITAFFVSCEIYPQDDYEEFYVVESYLVANRELPQIRLSKTVRTDEVYNFETSAINNALVEVRLLESGPESAVLEAFSYINPNNGIYEANEIHQVLPLRTYELHISFSDLPQTISAHATVPDTFRVIGGVRDSILYQSSDQLEITLSESSCPGRQNIFVFNALSEHPSPDNLTPFYLGLFEESDSPQEDLLLYSNNSSGIINEGNFNVNPDGTFIIKFPWIGIAFYEENKIVANTIDDNIYDFVRSQQVQLGGSTLSPGEIQNVIYHVDGGIGVFGALASDTVATYVKRPDF